MNPQTLEVTLNHDEREARRDWLIRVFLLLGSTLVSIGCILLVYVAVARAEGEFDSGASLMGTGRAFGSTEMIALQQAEAYWSSQPTDCTTRTLEVVASGALGSAEGHDLAAYATIPSAEPTPCGMWVEEDALSGDLCSLLRHEYGHWLGFTHQDPELATMPACDPEAVLPLTQGESRKRIWSSWRRVRTSCPHLTNRARKRCYLRASRLNLKTLERIDRAR